MTIERHASANALASAEMAAIRNEAPAYNVMGRRPGSGDSTPRVIVVDQLDATAGYWKSIQFEEIESGDLIRCAHYGLNEVMVQGVADDCGYVPDEESFDNDIEAPQGIFSWFVYTSDFDMETVDAYDAMRCDIKRWTTPDPNDPVVASAHHAIVERLARLEQYAR